ncbi:heavy-metal-associated domain-containing protein [Kribbella sp. NPDC004536]|uniref:heavy-metal-associated domain-containing protein n=1 Tax=Kribbella sp. NPDC004536 TaxID=3364106 RepID=UPI0036915458
MSVDTARTSVARLLSELAFDLFDGSVPIQPLGLRYELEPVSGLLTEEFLRTKLDGCPPGLITVATHRVTWTDSAGVSNVAHAGALGAVVPIVARETTLALWRQLDDGRLVHRTASLSPADTALLADVTTDKEPLAILRTGVDAAARVLVQHAYLAAWTPYDDPAAFAAVLRDSGLFATVAGTWHWGLQAATYRRGLIPAQLICFGGRVNYSADTVAALRAMKELRIADPSVEQYRALGQGERPRCLAHAPQTVDGRRVNLVTQVADLFVDTFIRLLDVVELTADGGPSRSESAVSTTTFEVPDMTCQHCIGTITKAVAEFGVAAPTFDLETKRVVADFPSPAVRDQSFAAIRTHGYTVVPLAE